MRQMHLDPVVKTYGLLFDTMFMTHVAISYIYVFTLLFYGIMSYVRPTITRFMSRVNIEEMKLRNLFFVNKDVYVVIENL